MSILNRARLIILASLVACLAPGAANAQRKARQGRELEGTWRLVEHWDKDSAGTLAYQYGSHPIGLFIHDATGHFSVQIMQTPSARAVPPVTDTAGVRRFIDGYYASFGTFTVDRVKGQSIYHVEGSTVPTLIGTDASLPFRISADSLIIGDSQRWRRVWLRVR